MFNIKTFLMAAIMVAVPVFAFAEEVIVPPSAEDIKAFLEAIGGIKGLGALGIASVVVQGLMLLAKSSIGGMLGKYRLLLVYFLSVVSGVIALSVSGLDIGAALLHANSLAAFQVFLNQVYKQFFIKED